MDSAQSACSWCGAKRPGIWARFATATGLDGNGDWLVQGIVALNVVFYLLALLLSRHRGLGGNPLSFLSPDNTSLLLLGATGALPVLDMGRFWTLLSANYLHGGLLHILFNMMALRQIGPWVSSEFGTSRMFIIYTLSGVCGYLVSCLAAVPLTIGASASVCGLIGALFFFGKSRGGNYGAAVSREVSGWLISLVLFGLIMPGINNWGHGGGIVGGILLGKLLGYRELKRESGGHRLFAVICGVATVVVLAMAAFAAVAFRFGR
jgi:rhomboid protease GluP